MGFLGLPLFFLFSKQFHNKRKNLKPGKATVNISNLSVLYKTKKQQKKKDISDIAFNDLEMALKQLELHQNDGVVCALVGETGSGKSTALSFIAGEVQAMTDRDKYIVKRYKQLKNKPTIFRLNEL